MTTSIREIFRSYEEAGYLHCAGRKEKRERSRVRRLIIKNAKAMATACDKLRSNLYPTAAHFRWNRRWQKSALRVERYAMLLIGGKP